MKNLILLLPILLSAFYFHPTYGNRIHEEIYNGNIAPPGHSPYTTLHIQQDYYDAYTFCSGAVISNTWVLTASHCCIQIFVVYVYLGLRDINNGTGVTYYTVYEDGIYPHPQYDNKTLANDICLIFTSSEVVFTDNIQPVSLPKLANAVSGYYNGKSVTSTGWGQTTDDQQGINQYKIYVVLQILNQIVCANYYQPISNITNSVICTSKKPLKAGPCHGDSGGPIVTTDNSGTYLVGVVSWGVGNCSSTNPVVFTNVCYFLGWINNVTGIPIS